MTGNTNVTETLISKYHFDLYNYAVYLTVLIYVNDSERSKENFFTPEKLRKRMRL